MSRYAMCDYCGHRLSRVYDKFGNFYDEYECRYCNAHEYDDLTEEEIEELENSDEGEGLSVYDAALIWASYGKDEDYMFGYSEDELEEAL